MLSPRSCCEVFLVGVLVLLLYWLFFSPSKRKDSDFNFSANDADNADSTIFQSNNPVPGISASPASVMYYLNQKPRPHTHWDGSLYTDAENRLIDPIQSREGSFAWQSCVTSPFVHTCTLAVPFLTRPASFFYQFDKKDWDFQAS